MEQFCILEFQNNEFLAHFHPRNTPEIDSINGTNGWSRIGGIDIDNNNDLWLTNSETNRPLLKFSTKSRKLGKLYTRQHFNKHHVWTNTLW